MARILVVDDEEVLAQLLATVLRAEGYEVTAMDNGCDALREFGSRPFALVVTDLMMPDMEGMELISRLRELSPATPIIAMSGGGRVGADLYLRTATQLGVVATLCKPFDLNEFIGVVQRQVNAVACPREINRG